MTSENGLEDGEVEEGEIVGELLEQLPAEVQVDEESGSVSRSASPAHTDRRSSGREGLPQDREISRREAFRDRLGLRYQDFDSQWQHSINGEGAQRRSRNGGRSPVRRHRSRYSPYKGQAVSRSASFSSVPSENDSEEEGQAGTLPQPSGDVRPHKRQRYSRSASSDSDSELYSDNSIQDLTHSVRRFTASVTLADAMRSLDTVCHDLTRALEKLKSLQIALTASGKPATTDESSILLELGVSFFAGLRAVNVLSNTGACRTQNLNVATSLAEAVVKDAPTLLTSAQQRELAGWMKKSKLFNSTSLANPAAATVAHKDIPNGSLVAIHHHQAVERRNEGAHAAGQAHAWGNGTQAAEAQHPAAPASSTTRTAHRLPPSRLPSLPHHDLPPPPGLDAPRVAQAPFQDALERLATPQASLPGPPPLPANMLQGQAAIKQQEEMPPGLDMMQTDQQSGLVTSHIVKAPVVSTFANDNFAHLDIPDDAVALVRRGKLCLVLDLDHTLVNSVKFTEITPDMDERLEEMQRREHAAADGQRLLFRMDNIQMWTKLRPGVHGFLQRASENFELWIHTNGNRSYAHAVVDLLDPGRTLFSQRIIAQGAAAAQGDEGGQGPGPDLSKRLMQGLEGREPVAIIVDDTSSVWSAHLQNLLAVERYVYFPSSRRQFNMKGKSLLELNRDECPNRGMLMVALGILMRVHEQVMRAVMQPILKLPKNVSEHHSWDTRHILQAEREKVLRGVVILFSRVIPLEQDPEVHPLWKLGQSFGAACVKQQDEGITHVVATMSGTEKVHWAQRSGRHVVTPACGSAPLKLELGKRAR